MLSLGKLKYLPPLHYGFTFLYFSRDIKRVCAHIIKIDNHINR